MTTLPRRRGSPPGPRPHTWISGPEQQSHDQYIAWARNRAQAHFRNEPWHLTFEQYQQVWANRWHLRGRGRHCLLMVRTDWTGAWAVDNVRLVGRAEFNRRQREIKIQRQFLEQQ